MSFFIFGRRRRSAPKSASFEKKSSASRHNGGGESSFSDPLGTPNVFAEVAVFASHEGGAGRRACARWTYLAQRDGASPVDVAHRALPGGRVSEGDDHLLPEQGLRKSGANRQKGNEDARSRTCYLRRRRCPRRRRGCGDVAETPRVGQRSIAKPETRVTHLEMRRVQPRQRLLARRTTREARGSREGAGQMKEGRARRQTVARENTTPRVRAGNARGGAFRRSRRSIVFRERTSRTPGIAIASLEDCSRVTHASWPPIVRSRDAFPSCKLCRTMNDAAFPGWRAAACDASATDRSARPAKDATWRDCLTAPCGFLGVPRLARAARAQ